MSDGAVTVSVSTSGVAHVEMNRPHARNAWDDTLGDGLSAVFSDLAVRPEVRAVLLTGAGTVFCAGADLVAGFPTTGDGHDDLRTVLRRRFHPAFLALLDLPQPVVAAVHGPAIGAGACLALAADVAVMAREAYLQFRFTRIGLMPDVAATGLVTELVGPARATELFLLADPVDAAECLRLGLVSRVRDAAEVPDEARGLAERLAAGPTRAFAATKQAVRAWSRRGLGDQMELEASLQQTLVATDDWAEGRAAFRERRDPHYTGR